MGAAGLSAWSYCVLYLPCYYACMTLLTEGTRILGVAKMLAAELGRQRPPRHPHPGGAPRQAARHRLPAAAARHRPRPDARPGVRPLKDAEKSRLGAPGNGQCYHRDGLLLYDLAEIAAVTSLVWLPAMLRVEACLDLASGAVPAGKALPGMRRTDRRALALSDHERERCPADGLSGGLDIAVTASAVLIVDGWPAAIATERIPREFIDLLAQAREEGPRVAAAS